MIETSDIYKSIKTVLENNFEETIQEKDIKTPVPPCFYIKYINSVNTQSATEYIEKKVNFDIIYYSAEETMADLVEKEQTLNTIFTNPLKIADTNTFQEIDSITITFNETDYILNCRLEFIINQCIGESETTDIINRYGEIENDEYIEELEI